MFASTARRAVGCSTFSTAKRSARYPAAPDADAAAQTAPSCDLGLWLIPGSPPTPEERRARRAATPSMNSEGSVTTCVGGGAGEKEPELLNLFV
ncbi:hypothetical protein GUJ93_ZPchr0013g35077 [Zizania palustris]|uniref:Uncharacterized protein n=1 Tax=Zizania palustris TaxID=103762 RepID=A0A8J5X3Y3_ZIZPA|nr:hypothetical protein GUJ93_ZPchr0013g35077 [Zizania palustris]